MRLKFPSRRHQTGYTLLEILVVISIIAILIALGTASFTTAQKKSRDARRREDMKMLQTAMEQVYANNAAKYPTGTAGLTQTYLPGGIPRDPKGGSSYSLSFDSANGTGYCFCATLENNDGNASGATNFTCNYVLSSGSQYCVSNLQ